MLITRKLSERNRSAFDTTAEILRELKEPSGITTILLNCSVSFKRSGCSLGFMKTSDVTLTDAAVTVATEYHEDIFFENRKRRPQERGRKKRRKGKWNPIDRLWNSANSKDCRSRHILEQD
jgi:hypothetical protein